VEHSTYDVPDPYSEVGPGFDAPPIGEPEEGWAPEDNINAEDFGESVAPPVKRFDVDSIWNTPAPVAPARPTRSSKASLIRRRNTPSSDRKPPILPMDDLEDLPRSADDAPGVAVWIRGRRVDATFLYVKDDDVTIQVGGETRTVRGPLHREVGPAVVEPDGTKRFYSQGALSRDGGPAIEASDAAQDVYAIRGAVKPLDLPPTLSADRAFRSRLFSAWERAGFPGNAELQARALLAVMPSEEREPILSSMRSSTDKHDLQFAESADALYGRPDIVKQPTINDEGVTDVPPLPPSLASHTEDDFDEFYDSLISDGPNP
jgi:hypothetical protein